MTDRIPEDAWEQTTWEGNRRAQLRDALSLTLRERLQAVEDMAEVAERFRQMRAHGKKLEREQATDARN